MFIHYLFFVLYFFSLIMYLAIMLIIQVFFYVYLLYTVCLLKDIYTLFSIVSETSTAITLIKRVSPMHLVCIPRGVIPGECCRPQYAFTSSTKWHCYGLKKESMRCKHVADLLASVLGSDVTLALLYFPRHSEAVETTDTPDHGPRAWFGQPGPSDMCSPSPRWCRRSNMQCRNLYTCDFITFAGNIAFLT